MTQPTPFVQVQGQGSVNADQLNTLTQSVINLSQLRGFIGLPNMTVMLEGSSVPADGGQGVFYWNGTATGPDDGVNTIVPTGAAIGAWIRLIGSGSPFSVITYVVDGGGSALSTGVVGDLYIPFASIVTAATLLADQTGSVEVDIWAAPYASYPPTIANTIVAAAPPTITASDHSQDTTLTGWTTSIAAGDTLRFNINSVSTITRLTIALTVV